MRGMISARRHLIYVALRTQLLPRSIVDAELREEALLDLAGEGGGQVGLLRVGECQRRVEAHLLIVAGELPEVLAQRRAGGHGGQTQSEGDDPSDQNASRGPGEDTTALGCGCQERA